MKLCLAYLIEKLVVIDYTWNCKNNIVLILNIFKNKEVKSKDEYVREKWKKNLTFCVYNLIFILGVISTLTVVYSQLFIY